jgi:multisubunit Na+/H+ antiporter MnhB subunit
MKNLLVTPNTQNHCEIKNKSMTRRYFYLFFVGLTLCALNLQSISAQTTTDNTIEKIKTNVSKRGTGEKERVNVKMRNGTKMKGFISQAGQDSFTLTDSKTKQTSTLAYSDVAQVKGTGLSTTSKILIGVGIGVGVSVAVLAIAFRNFDPLSLNGW